MSRATHRELALGELLDHFADAQRQDVHAYCSGHLNESRLYRPLDQAPYTKWSTSTTNNSTLPQVLGKTQSVEKHSRAVEKMKDSLLSFSLGAPLLPFVRPHSRAFEHLEASPRRLEEQRSSLIQLTSFVNSSPLPTVWQQKSLSNHTQTVDHVSSSSVLLPNTSPLLHDIQTGGYNRGRRTPDDLPIHLNAVTKKDKFRNMKEFEAQFLRNSGSFQHRGSAGSQVTEHLERRLEQKLKQFDASVKSDVPNLSRIEVCAEVFEELIESSPTFCFLLRQIKNAYEAYLSSLVENQETNSSLEQSTSRLSINHSDATTAAELEREVTRVSRLELRAKELLEQNQSLRRELGVLHSSRPSQQDSYDLQSSSYDVQQQQLQQPAKLSRQVEQLRCDIFEKIESIQDLRIRLKTECVPSPVCSDLRQCLRDNQLETQKMKLRKKFFEERIVELDRDLHRAVESAESTDRDAKLVFKRIWKRIQVIKTDCVGDPLESDEDGSAKWSWYIS